MRPARALIVVACGLLLLSAAWSDRFPALDPEQFQARLERWRAMDADERAEVMERWRRFQSMPEARQRQLKVRMGALERMRRRHHRRHAAQPGPDSLRVAMGAVEAQARAMLHLDARDDVRDAVKLQQRRRVLAFLDNLTADDRLHRLDRDRLQDLPFEDLVQEALLIQKRELLALHADAGTTGPEADLQALDPMEVMDEIRRQRRQRVFLGRAGKLLKLSEARRQELSEALDEGRMNEVQEWLRPLVRAALRERGVSPRQIDATIEVPFAEMERRLSRLLRNLPEPRDR
jgi:hypothetical protein